jgi:hypothetical protein
VHLVGVVDDRHDAATIRRHLDATKAALGVHLSPRTYLNVLDGAARAGAAVTSIDADDLAAIRALRAAIDPADTLRFGVQHSSG